MDKFLVPLPPGSEAALHQFVTTYKPTAAAVDRQRKTVVDSTSAATGNGKKKRARRGANALSSSNPVTITAAARVKEFGNQSLEVSAGRLFCAACSSRLGTRKSTIMSHCGILKSGAHVSKQNKHMRKMVLFNASKLETPQRMSRFSDFCERKNTYGKNLQPEVNDKRVKVTQQYFFFKRFLLFLLLCTYK